MTIRIPDSSVFGWLLYSGIQIPTIVGNLKPFWLLFLNTGNTDSISETVIKMLINVLGKRLLSRNLTSFDFENVN
jgi:hypothetical protein